MIVPDAAHNYSRGDRAALILFSGGTCYWPSCTDPLLKMVDGSYEIALEIAHIRAAKKGGERYVEDMDDAARAAFDNIIFLCIPHHKAVDQPRAGEKYTINLLCEWKEKRENGAPEQLRGLREVTEGKLLNMISTAVQERDTDYHQTLARLEENDQEAAALLRELRTELEGLRNRGSTLDPDMVTMLDRAGRDLTNLGDYAPMLERAADKLGGLEDGAIRLEDAGSILDGLGEYILRLNQVARNLDLAAGRIEDAGSQFS